MYDMRVAKVDKSIHSCLCESESERIIKGGNFTLCRERFLASFTSKTAREVHKGARRIRVVMD